jgi:glycine cleavage system aminomethyltransferase T
MILSITNRTVEKGYLFRSSDYDEETSYKKYEAELERIIKKK